MKTSALALAVLASMVTDATGQSPALFRTPIQDLGTQWTTPTQGRIPHGDLDGDGLVDLLVPDNANAVVTVWIGTGDGRFSAAPAVATAADPSDVAVADVDGDGALDFAVACDAANVVQIHRGNGAGGFALLQTIPVLPGTANVLLHDFDADGDEDLLAGHHVGFTTFTNTPAGFVAGATVPLPGGLTIRAIRLGAVDTDSVTDVFVLADSSAVVTFRGDGLGGFAVSGVALGAGGSQLSVSFDVGDLDQDGDDDVVFVHSTMPHYTSRTLVTLENDGAGALTTVSSSPWPSSWGTYVVLHDLIGDAPLDLWIEGKGVLRGGAGFTFAVSDVSPYTLFDGAAAVADLDGDGRVDLASLRLAPWVPEDRVTVLRADDRGGYGAQFPRPADPTQFCGPGFGLTTTDIDSDGDRDIVVPCSFNHMHVARNDGHGHFPPSEVLPLPIPTYPGFTPTLAFDLDQDGADELYIGSDELYRFPPDGAGAYGAPALFVQATATGVDDFRFGDVDGDGNADVAVASGKRITWSLGDGAGNVTAGGILPHTGIVGSALRLADLDNDGRLDLLAGESIGTSQGAIRVWRSIGPGQFGAPTSYPTTGPHPRWLALDDFDLDGNVDVATLLQWSGCVLAGDGAGGLLAAQVLPNFPIVGYGLAAGDFDGDQRPDLAVAASDELLVFLGDGLGGFPVTDPYLFGAGELVAEDLDGDTLPDLISVSPSLLRHLSSATPCNGTITSYGAACAGADGFAPTLGAYGCASPGGHVRLELDGGLGGAPALFVAGSTQTSIGLGSGCSAWIAPLAVASPVTLLGVNVGTGSASITIELPAAVLPGTVTLQAFVADAANPLGFTASNGLALTVQ